jgi:YD repeat-containing protein
MERSTGNAQTETFTWDRQQISTNPTDRGYVNNNDGVTYAPLLTNRTVTRSGSPYSTSFSGFDGYGNPGTIVESGQRTRTITRSYCINSAKWVVNKPGTEIISGAGTISRTFNGNCDLTSESRFGVNTSFGRLPTGDIASRTDARSKTINYSAYYRGIPQSESRPDGSTIARAVSSAGNVTQQSDGAGQTHSYGFDGLRRPTSWNPPAGASMSISWAGSTSRNASRGGYSEQATYDGIGNPTSVTRAGIARDFEHDDFQQLTFESLPGVAGGTSLSRDILGRVLRMTHLDGTARILGFSGNTVRVTDERSNQTTYRYESYGDPDQKYLVGVDLPNGQNIAIARDALGNIRSVTQGSFTRTYTYNSSYFLTNINDPETGDTSFGRDSVGNMTSMTVGGRTTSYAYDGMNRLITISHPDGERTDITYFGDGRARQVKNSKATTDYEYDANRNLTKETLKVDALTFITQYAYSSIDALSSITYPHTGEVVDYGPNTLGRPTKVGSYITTVAHRNSGNLSSLTYANGVSMSLAETSRHWPSSVRATKAGVFVDKTYSFDATGNVDAISDGINAARSLNLGYDTVNRLTSASGPWGTGSLSYDSVGNLNSYSLGGVPRSYAYATKNRLTSFEGRSFSYDGYGNVTGDGLHTYLYSDASNLTCVDCAAAGKIEYGYDGNNRRVWRKQNGVATYYVHAADGDLLLEHTPSSELTVQHVYLKGQRVATKTITP